MRLPRTWEGGHVGYVAVLRQLKSCGFRTRGQRGQQLRFPAELFDVIADAVQLFWNLDLLGAVWRALAEATAEDVGKIAGADGYIYNTKAAAEAVATGNAVAMIAYVGNASDCTNGLAIALEDVSSNALSWKNSGSNNGGKTAAEWCSAWNTSKAVTGGTWRLPSIKDWQNMLIGCGASGTVSDSPSSMSYSGLASKLSTADGTALQSDHYWSSTESLPGYGAWCLRFDGSSADFSVGSEVSGYLVRAFLAF